MICGLLRYVLLASGYYPAMLVSVCLHGPLFAAFYLTCQIYLEQRVEPRMRSQSQALLSLMNSGLGNAIGYLSILWWYHQCDNGTTVDWTRFWGALAIGVAVLTVIFVTGYKGQKRTPA